MAAAAGSRRAGTGLLAVLLLFGGVFAAGAGLGRLSGPWHLPDWLVGPGNPPPREFPVLDPSRPTRITIPSLDVQAPVHPVGLAADGTVAAPEGHRRNEAGWYEQGPTPGQFGPAMIVGHVDTRRGPAVFHNLASIRPGARVEITRRDRRVAIFEVTRVRSYDKASLPVDEVYGDFSRPALRLITCGGRWVGGETGYAENVVVYATLVDAHRA